MVWNYQSVIWSAPLKIYEHKSVENCIKVTGIVSRFVSSTKHSLILKLYPGKPVDTQFYCSCKSGARTTNPCALSLCILILIQSIQKQLPRLLSTRNTTNYHSVIKFEQYSSHYQAIYDNIKDCKIYKEWSTFNETYCICNESYEEEDWMAKYSICHELYHPRCIGQIQEIEENIYQCQYPYCEEDEKWEIINWSIIFLVFNICKLFYIVCCSFILILFL